MIDFRCSFLVVSKGKLSLSAKRICRPKTDRVPVPVRSDLGVPVSSSSARRSRYCFSPAFMDGSYRDLGEELAGTLEPLGRILRQEPVDDWLIAGQPFRQARHRRTQMGA